MEEKKDMLVRGWAGGEDLLRWKVSREESPQKKKKKKKKKKARTQKNKIKNENEKKN